MTCQVQAFPFTFDRTTGETRTEFASAAAARRYMDRAGRMDGRQMHAARLTDEKAGVARTLANFPTVGRENVGRDKLGRFA